MAGLHESPQLVKVLSDEGIVIQATNGGEVIADYWKHGEEHIRRTLTDISHQLGIAVRFRLQARG